MSVEKTLVAALLADSGIAAITTRIYPNYIPQNAAYPLIVYQKGSGPRDHALGGPTGKAHPRFQIEAWADTYDAAKGLASAIRTALDGKRYTLGGTTISALLQNEFDGYEEAEACHRIVSDFSIWHNE